MRPAAIRQRPGLFATMMTLVLLVLVSCLVLAWRFAKPLYIDLVICAVCVIGLGVLAAITLWTIRLVETGMNTILQ